MRLSAVDAVAQLGVDGGLYSDIIALRVQDDDIDIRRRALEALMMQAPLASGNRAVVRALACEQQPAFTSTSRLKLRESGFQEVKVFLPVVSELLLQGSRSKFGGARLWQVAYVLPWSCSIFGTWERDFKVSSHLEC